MNEVFKQWCERDIHKGHLFITDGIIDTGTWSRADCRVLFLLKEAYHEDRSCGTWDLVSYIRKHGASGRTFKPLAQWALGVQRIFSSNGEISEFKEEGPDVRNALLSSAVVNIKKSSGKKASNSNDLLRYVESDWDMLTQQIESISPTIVICGRTWPLIKEKLKERKKISDRAWLTGGRLYMNYWHPANRASNLMNYYSLCALVAMAYQRQRAIENRAEHASAAVGRSAEATPRSG